MIEPRPIEVEFDCVECGRHIVVVTDNECRRRVCAPCMAIPGWFRDPELRARIDPQQSKSSDAEKAE